MTKYAEKILDLINSSTSHLTAEQVYSQLKRDGCKIVLATVYNNLNGLCERGLVRRISIDGSPDMYDKTLKHDHLVCKKCGKLADFGFDDITESLRRQLGGEVLSYDLKVYYICPECEKNK